MSTTPTPPPHPQPPCPPAFLTVAQAAPLLGVTPDTLYALCRLGQIAHRRLGPKRGMIRLTAEDVAAYREGARRGGRAARRGPVRRAARPQGGGGPGGRAAVGVGAAGRGAAEALLV
jgi:excisionase family DNA binding protein